MAKVILRPSRSAGKWRFALAMMRQCWLDGEETMYVTRHFESVTSKYPMFQNLYLQWLGEMEMFKYEGGLRAYERWTHKNMLQGHTQGGMWRRTLGGQFAQAIT